MYCPFAHGWDEKVEYICTEAGLLKCGKKKHMGSYTLWGVYVVEDGRNVSDYLNSIS